MFLSGVKSAIHRLNGSISARLTAWYCFVSFLFAVLAATTMYWFLVNHLLEDNDNYLRGRINELSSIILAQSGSNSTLLAEMQRETENAPGSQVRVKWGNGESLIETPAAGKSIFSQHEDITQNIKTGGSRTWQSPQGVSYRVITSHIEGIKPLDIEMALDRTTEKRLLDDFWLSLISIVSVLFIGAATGGVLIARRELAPLSRLGKLVEQINAEDLHQRLDDYDWPTEIKPLTFNFDRLLSRLEDAFSRVSQFSADIAHELRTPLHVLRGEVEIVLTQTSSKEDYRLCLESAAEEYARLTSMVEGLLFLAKSSQMDSPLTVTEIYLNDEVTLVCDFYQAIADEENAQFDIRVSGMLSIDSGLFRRALGNVISNAIRYSPEGGTILISSTDGLAEGLGYELTIKDSGIGIAAHELDKVFDRFFRSNQARSRTSDGTGLGLPIVKNIMALHKGEVLIESTLGLGTSVTLRFPNCRI